MNPSIPAIISWVGQELGHEFTEWPQVARPSVYLRLLYTIFPNHVKPNKIVPDDSATNRERNLKHLQEVFTVVGLTKQFDLKSLSVVGSVSGSLDLLRYIRRLFFAYDYGRDSKTARPAHICPADEDFYNLHVAPFQAPAPGSSAQSIPRASADAPDAGDLAIATPLAPEPHPAIDAGTDPQSPPANDLLAENDRLRAQLAAAHARIAELEAFLHAAEGSTAAARAEALDLSGRLLAGAGAGGVGGGGLGGDLGAFGGMGGMGGGVSGGMGSMGGVGGVSVPTLQLPPTIGAMGGSTAPAYSPADLMGWGSLTGSLAAPISSGSGAHGVHAHVHTVPHTHAHAHVQVQPITPTCASSFFVTSTCAPTTTYCSTPRVW